MSTNFWDNPRIFTIGNFTSLLHLWGGGGCVPPVFPGSSPMRSKCKVGEIGTRFKQDCFKQEEHIMQFSTIRNQVPAGVSIPFWQCNTDVNDLRKHLEPFLETSKFGKMAMKLCLV